MGRLARPIRRPDWSKLDRRRPFNLDYPGWAGCQFALMGFPHLRGGPTWVDPWHKIDGTLMNMDPVTDWVATEYGTALDFDGSDDYVNLGSPSLFAFGSSDFFIELFVQPNSLASRKQLFTKDSATGRSFEVCLNNSGSGTVTIVLHHDGGVTGVDTATGTVSTGVWAHLVLARIGASLRIWVNGNEQSTTTSSGAGAALTTSSAINSTGTECWIGRRVYSGFQEPFDGKVHLAKVVTRTIHDSLAMSLRDQANTGHPDALRWLRGRSMVSVPAGGGGGGGFKSAWARGSNVLIHPGAM